MLALKEEKFILLTFLFHQRENRQPAFFKSSTIKVREHLGLLWK